VVLMLVVLALAGLQWLKPQEGLNIYFLLDRSDSVPSPQQEAARRLVNRWIESKPKTDKAGLLAFGAEAALETTASDLVDTRSTKVLAVVNTERTDIAAAIRLGTAAFPERGQKRLVLLSDGQENLGDALTALLQAKPLGVSLDVVPLGVERGQDISLQRLSLPSQVKPHQPFEVKVFVQSDQARSALLRVYRNQVPFDAVPIQVQPGKNLFAFQQTLGEPGFYTYTVHVEAAGDPVPQNNQAIGFVSVRGEPRVLIVSAAPDQDRPLAEALQSAKLQVKLTDLAGLPTSLAELADYDSVFISNLAAGDLGEETMKRIESAVRDFGVGLVCVGGDQTYTAGAYRGTPLERVLPVDMELDSKKVLPKGAVALVMHGMEFANGNQVARDCALGVLDALGPQDELGVVLWDGTERWLVPLSPVGDKRAHGRAIAGMNQGDLPSFQGVMTKAYEALRQSTANLKHIIVFSDGDPAPPSPALMENIRAARITVSTVLIAGHAGPDTMIQIAEAGGGQFYNVQDPAQLPQIFIKEAALILKSAIIEEPFRPQQTASSELLKGISPDEFPTLLGYVSTSPKARAETPLVSHRGDPVLAHWQIGLGRAAAFTSDAKARWARDWLAWPKYRQFWAQVAQWSLRRLDNADLTAEVSVDQGQGHLSVEALDEKGDYRNFLHLQAVVVSPKGERQTVRLDQTGPGRYETRFAMREVGSYLINLMEIKDGQVAGVQWAGASINHSPEYSATGPNWALLRRLAELGGGRVLDPSHPTDNPFLHDRQKTFQPLDLWQSLLKWAIVLFVLDVGVRRIQIDRDEWLKATATLRRLVLFWKAPVRPVQPDESLAALLARRDQVRAARTGAAVEPPKPVAPAARAPAQPGLPPRPSPPLKPQPMRTSQPPAAPQPEPEGTPTTRRLLEAKKRVQQRS
jgi:uncharacterized membrane protein